MIGVLVTVRFVSLSKCLILIDELGLSSVPMTLFFILLYGTELNLMLCS